MNAALTALLALLGQLLPAIGNTTLIGRIIDTLTAIIPVLVKEVQDVIPMIKNIIAALKSDPSTTAAQLATLAALDSQVDAAFEAAVAARDAAPSDAAPAA